MAIEINTGASKPQINESLLQQTEKLTGDATKTKEVISKALEVLAGSNLTVSRGTDTSATGNVEKKTTGATNVPVLDNPADPEQIEADLTKLIMYLQLDNEERQTEMAKDRIDLNKAGLDTEHKDRMKHIDETVKKMKDAEKASFFSRLFGWIGAVLAVVAAAVLTVATGGLAAGFAIAGAAIAVTALTLSETGAMDKIINALADHLQETYGMSKNDAMLAASLIVNLSIMAAQLGCSIGGMVAGFSAAASAAANATATATKAAGDVAKTGGEVSKLSANIVQLAKNMQSGVTIANTAVGAGALASNGVSTYMTHRSEDAKADTTELEKFMTMLQQRLEESQEELQIILQQIQAGIGKIAELISSATDTSDQIARNIGAMA